jgi:hypothetical protein
VVWCDVVICFGGMGEDELGDLVVLETDFVDSGFWNATYFSAS